MLRKEANIIQNNSKILRKVINNIIKESHSIKDNNILHRKERNDNTQVKISNNISPKIVIPEQFFIRNLKNKLSSELK